MLYSHHYSSPFFIYKYYTLNWGLSLKVVEINFSRKFINSPVDHVDTFDFFNMHRDRVGLQVHQMDGFSLDSEVIMPWNS